jgi:transposase
LEDDLKRYLEQKNDEVRKWIEIIEKSSIESEMTRNRARAVRLSFDKFSAKEIAKICNVTIYTVYTWFDNWEERGFDSLLRMPGQGRKAEIDESELDQVFEIADENPKQLKAALPKIEKVLGKKISIYTLQRIIRKKKAGGALGNL